jgi:hypothetical protein
MPVPAGGATEPDRLAAVEDLAANCSPVRW